MKKTSPRIGSERRLPAVTADEHRWMFNAAVGISVLLAVIVRVAAARSEFWFDEVWSLMAFAQKATSPWDVFKFHHDNNHHLITLWMYVCGQQSEWMIYRVPSILAGAATVILAARLARPWGPWGMLSAAILTSSSFLLITYASEARGYALAGCFALAAWWALDRYLTTRAVWGAAVFSLAIVLCLLSHVTGVFFYAGALAWSLMVIFRSANSPREAAIEALKCHVAPMAFLAGFYALHIQGMAIGGGPRISLADVITQSLALSIGGSNLAWLNALLALVVLVVAIYGLVSLWREGSALWILFGVSIFVAPAIVLLIQRPTQLYPRYFYLPLVMMIVLLSYVLARLSRLSSQGPYLAMGVLALIVAVNGWQTFGLLRYGRGQYIEALRYMAEQSSSGTLSLQSDHDYESRYMLTFYQSYLPASTRLTYLMQDAPTDAAPEWTVVYGQSHPFRPHPSINDARGRKYDLQQIFPYAGLSGYHWAVYRLAPPTH